jgi:hypothetical protein
LNWKELLQKKLLPLGGQKVIYPPFEEDLENILIRGKEWSTKRRKFMKGQMCQCHWNTCQLWYVNQDQVQIATGYALFEGNWHQHSWGIQNYRIVETTISYDKYFGFVMTDEEANKFYFDNY